MHLNLHKNELFLKAITLVKILIKLLLRLAQPDIR